MSRISVPKSAEEPNSSFPPVAGHVLIGITTAVLVALLDVAQSSIRQVPPRVEPVDAVVAALHLTALYSLVGLAFGIGFGMSAAVLGRSRVVSAALRASKRRGYWWQADPWAWSQGISAVAAATFYFVLIARTYVVFTTTFHRADLAGYLLASLALVGAVLAWALRSFLSALLAPLAGRIGVLASRASVVLVVVLGVASCGVILFLRDTQLRFAYDPAALALGPASMLVWLGLRSVLSLGMRKTSAWRVRSLAFASSLAVLGGVLTSATSFGESNRVRSVVEQRSVMGRSIIRRLQSLSDRDGDRYAWAFGGGDCDDSNPEVHPGALDEEGDGIDQDCFAGDGAPLIAPRGRGEFGRLPTGLARPNVLVVTIDALRRDHLSFAGYARPTSPHIDRFAQTAVDFARAVPQSSRSIRSIPAMWIGNYASEIAFGPEYLWPALLPENVTAAELMRDRAGYQTSAIMATEYFGRIDGFFQGFERVLQSPLYDPPRDEAVNAALPELGRLANQGSPWLLWVHLFNCHGPYLQDGARSAYGSEPVDLYDTEVGFADEQFQRLLDRLDELGVAQNTVVVLASDHGEGFGEHGSFGHASTLYEEEMQAVLMLRLPGVRARRIDAPVGLLDVAPTLMNVAGVAPPFDISGSSLVPMATGEREASAQRPIFAELLPDGLNPYDIKVMRRGARKLMWWVRDGTYQYFDLDRDPGELNDLSDAQRTEARAMLGELRAWVARSSRAENRSDVFVDQHRLRQLPANISHRTGIRYPGMFSVVGFDLPQTAFAPGDRIPLTFYYRVDSPIERDLFFLVDIVGPPGVALPPHFHAWHYPLHSRYPTTRWEPGEYVRDPTPIVIPTDITTPLRLRLELRVRDGESLLEAEHEGRREISVFLAEVEVNPS